MSRYHTLTILARYAEQYPDERDVAEQIALLISSRGDCFCRTCRPGHLTGSAWVVSRDRQRVALVHHRKLNRWLQPGGHADGDADVAGVAWREAREELGLLGLRLLCDQPLDIDVHIIPARYDAAGQLIDDAHEHHDLRYLFVADGSEQLVVSHESHEVAWFPLDRLDDVTDEVSVLRMRNKCRALWA